MSERVTKTDMYARIYDALIAADETELADWVEEEMAALAIKAEKAKARAAAKRAEGDEYKAIVAGALTDEFQTGAAIFEAVGDEDFTIAKVRARLTALVKDGSAVKEEVTVESDGKSRKVMAYRLA